VTIVTARWTESISPQGQATLKAVGFIPVTLPASKQFVTATN
jgi:hypothetical protein